jgi:hypothetical protein
VLFIEDHKPKGGQWHEDGRTGPHHDEGLIRIQTTAPPTHLFTVATSAVILHNPGAKTTAAAVDQLGNEANLWGKEQHMPALGKFIRSQLQIDLGFARARHTPKQ